MTTLSDLLTDAEIEEIRGRAEAATAGPWAATGVSMNDGSISITQAERRIVIACVTNAASFVDFVSAAMRGRRDFGAPDTAKTQWANARLIESSRTDIPRLLATLSHERSLRVEAERDKARLDFLDRCNNALNQHCGTTYRWKLILNHNVNRLMIGHMAVDLHDSEPNGLMSCRDAIDAEMRRVESARAAIKETRS